MKIMRAYKYRLYPTAEQEARLSAWVAAVRTVYNAALEQRNMYAPVKKEDQIKPYLTDEAGKPVDCPNEFVGSRNIKSARHD